MEFSESGEGLSPFNRYICLIKPFTNHKSKVLLFLCGWFSILHIGTTITDSKGDSEGLNWGIATHEEARNDNYLVGHAKLQELWLLTNKTFYNRI